MAGFHCCYRRLLVLKTSRLTDKNGVLLQFVRKKHHLVFQITSQSKLVFPKPKSILNTNRLLLYRLSSTNVMESKEPVSNANQGISDTKNELNQFHKESTQSNHQAAQLNNEKTQINNEPEIAGLSNANVIDEDMLPPIPTAVPEVPELDFLSMGLKEPTFESLGLGSWWPSGIIQRILEYLHINLDLPWWESILIITLVLRILMLPVNLKCRRDSVNMMKYMPQMNEIQGRLTKARIQGDYFLAAQYAQEMQEFAKKNKLNLFGAFKVALIQGPIFISMYYALNGIAKIPVESLKTEGLVWFTDLTQPDPYYILPVVLASTLLAVIETGSEGNPAKAASHIMKWVMRGMAPLVFVFSLNFPACITWYWTVSNVLSLVQVGFYKIPIVKKFFKIPELTAHDLKLINKNNKGFLEGFKEGFENAKLSNQVQERERLNLIQLQKAGNGPIPRTFKKNPLLQNAKKS